MSKVSFRARQIDFNKPLPIIRHNSEFLAEISENALVSRGVPVIPSGMEKEEENEHHFVEVIQALQSKKTADTYIPVPEIQEDQQVYFQLYPKGFILPNQYIHIRTAVFADDEPIEYDLDSEDERWLRSSGLEITPEKFEAMIDKLERGCGQKVLNLEEAKYLLQDDQSLAIAIYDYWLTKRVQCRQPLLLSVKQEKRDGASNNNQDPYVAFRRRTERMQTRKNRKNDENSYEKMLILREQMDVLDEIFSSLVKRETTKEALIANERDIFLTRYRLGDFDGFNLAESEAAVSKFVHPVSKTHDSPKKRLSKKRKGPWTKSEPAKVSSEEASEDEFSPDSQFAFVRVPGVKYLKPLGRLGSVPEEEVHPSLRYRLGTVPFVEHPRRHLYTGFLRRRLGRGGRVIYDRLPPTAVGVSPAYLDQFDEELSCYDHDSLGLVRPLQREHLRFESQFEATERLKATLPLTRFELDDEQWSLRPPEETSSEPPSPKMDLKRFKFDDRPPGNRVVISSLPPTSVAKRTPSNSSSSPVRLANGVPPPRMLNGGLRLANGLPAKSKAVPGKKLPPNGSTGPATATSSATSTARAC